jgi:hypothetical protein
MNYRNIYNSIINKYRNQPGITESHHIVPKSLGGDNNPENLVEVSPRVHYILHLLLYKMNSGNNKKKMWYAVWNMSNQGKIKTSSMYQFIREECSVRQKEIQPKVPWNKGVKGYKINQKPQKGIPKPHLKKPVLLDGIVYKSQQEATKATGHSHYYIKKYGVSLT